MKRIVLFSLVALVLGSCAVFAATTPKGSFLKSHVATLEQLVQQVVDDPIVAARYAKHFAMPRNSVVDYFEKDLRIGRLRRDYPTIVYSVIGKIKIVSSKKVLPEGSYVFIDQNNKPILEATTGNPLGEQSGTPETEPAPETATSEGIVTKVLGVPTTELGTTLPIEGAPAISIPGAAADLGALVDIVGSIPIIGGDAVTGPLGLGTILPLVTAFGGAAAASGGDGGGSNPPPTVPEPMSATALLMGVSSLVFIRIKRHQRD